MFSQFRLNFVRVLFCTWVVGTISVGAQAQTPRADSKPVPSSIKPNTPAKKLIEYGWDAGTITPTYIRDNIREMEKKPFQGVIYRLDDHVGQVFAAQAPWDKVKAQSQLKVLSDIKWDKFTDNFLAIYAASQMDWFSDADWEKIVERTRFCALAAKTAKSKGIMFDPEPYGNNPWKYKEQKHAATRSFDEYAQVARRRGGQFMRAMNGHMPALKLLMFFQYSMPYSSSSYDADPVKRAEAVNASDYGLMFPFLDGMLEAAGPQVQFIDGNEFSYYYTSPFEYYRSYNTVHEKAEIYVAPELRKKFRRQVRAAQALYVDYNFFLIPKLHAGIPSHGMTPEERARWFEHSVYYAMQSTDEYVWLYSENMDWWKNENLPPGIENALVSGLDKVRSHSRLGFDISTDIQAAHARFSAMTANEIKPRSARIERLKENTKHTIDGKLDEDFYTQVTPMDGFLPLLNKDKPKAGTRTWMAYDTQKLYVAFECQEPQIDKLNIAGSTHDSDVWNGDSVEVSIQVDPSAQSFYHFIINPSGTKWEGIDKGGSWDNVDASYNPQWESAVTRQKTSWNVEIAIPWKELKTSVPATGTTLRANLARQRTPEPELTSWSQFVGNFRELANLGTLTVG